MKIKTRIKTAIALAFSAILLTPMVALANRYIEQIKAQLLIIDIAIDSHANLSRLHTHISQTSGDRYEYVPLYLIRGKLYVLVGVCDSDCSDLDVRLYDKNNLLVSVDTSLDDIPMVKITPRQNGKVWAKVTMKDCKESFCYYGLGVYSR